MVLVAEPADSPGEISFTAWSGQGQPDPSHPRCPVQTGRGPSSQAQVARRAGLGGFVLDLVFAGLFRMTLDPLLGAAPLQPTLSGLLLGVVANEAVIASNPRPSPP